MSEQFSIPVPNLEMNPFDSPPLSLMAPSVGNAVAANTNRTMMPQENNQKYVFDERKVPGAPPAPCMPPALPVQGLWQPEAQGPPRTARAIASGPLSARAPMPPRSSPFDQGPNPGTPTVVESQHPQVTSTAPRKDDLAYKTTPCRHFTLNQGWCPWGDECGLSVSYASFIVIRDLLGHGIAFTIPSWDGSHHWIARRVARRPARRRSVATSLVYLTRPQLTLLLTRTVRSAAKAPTVGATYRASAHTRTRADTSIPLTSYPVRVFSNTSPLIFSY